MKHKFNHHITDKRPLIEMEHLHWTWRDNFYGFTSSNRISNAINEFLWTQPNKGRSVMRWPLPFDGHSSDVILSSIPVKSRRSFDLCSSPPHLTLIYIWNLVQRLPLEMKSFSAPANAFVPSHKSHVRLIATINRNWKFQDWINYVKRESELITPSGAINCFSM